MCELFGISSRHPARISICLHQIARHGGLVGPHEDGWGVAYYQDRAVRLIREPGPAWGNRWVRFLQEQALESPLVVSHIRHATQGSRTLSNTQPYARELGGRMHVFAHNGDLGDVRSGPVLPLGRFRPLGDTDSEHAFCFLLHELEALWLAAVGVPPLEERMRRIRHFADLTAGLGPLNFLYCDGDALFVHGDCRRNPGEADPDAPGLYALWRNFLKEANAFVAQGLRLASCESDDRAVLVASVPLTRENWIPLPRRELLAFSRGMLVAAAPPDRPAPSIPDRRLVSEPG